MIPSMGYAKNEYIIIFGYYETPKNKISVKL